MHGLVWAYAGPVSSQPLTELALFVRIDNINYFNKSHDKLQQKGT